MYFSTATILAATAALVGRAAAVDHQIVVGGAAGLVFTPPTVDAAVGDTVTFIFQSKNHTVTQSGFATPCTLLTNTTTNAVGFDSGFVPVAADATQLPAWTLEVTASNPIWFFCAQGIHCRSGMVGAINAAKTGDKTFEAFKALAMGTTDAASGGASANPSGIGATGGSQTSIPASDVNPAATTTTSSGAPAQTTAGGNSGASRLTGTGFALAAVAAVALVMA